MTSAFELHEDGGRLGEAVHTVEAGNVVFVLRHGERVAEITPPDMVLLAREQAVTMARTAAQEARQAADSIVESAARLGDASVREAITRPVLEIADHAEEAAAVATARLALARHARNGDVAAIWPWAVTLPADMLDDAMREFDAATTSDGGTRAAVQLLIAKWQEAAESHADPRLQALLAAEPADRAGGLRWLQENASTYLNFDALADYEESGR
ncbi:hypothetical protein [Dactylosporangium sp. CA-233914]|uniref:hypothetical protein n=1 Tax=Dactylosporangium sp. CA-233914 TaxID=3239934 RepID=UPI003D939D8B